MNTYRMQCIIYLRHCGRNWLAVWPKLCRANGIETVGGYSSYAPYQSAEEALKEKGFDVLVFIPSMDEEDGLVTCGNAILGGGQLKTNTQMVNITGTEIK